MPEITKNFTVERSEWMTITNYREYIKNIGIIFNHDWNLCILKNPARDMEFFFNLPNDSNSIKCNVDATFFIGSKLIAKKFMHINPTDTHNIIGVVRLESAYDVSIVLRFETTDKHMQQTSIEPETSVLRVAPLVLDESDVCQIQELSEDFQHLLFEEHLCDVTIKCKSEAFQVHKIILSARSPVFKAMFSNLMQETVTNTVTLDNLEPDTLRSLIKFVYGGQVRVNSTSEAISLMDTAEQYQIKSLKEGLIKYFRSVLSVQNVISILELADLYDKSLKEEAIKVIKNHFQTLKQEESWRDLKSRNPQLALEVYDSLI